VALNVGNATRVFSSLWGWADLVRKLGTNIDHLHFVGLLEIFLDNIKEGTVVFEGNTGVSDDKSAGTMQNVGDLKATGSVITLPGLLRASGGQNG
jgi:hypothetical protein